MPVEPNQNFTGLLLSWGKKFLPPDVSWVNAEGITIEDSPVKGWFHITWITEQIFPKAPPPAKHEGNRFHYDLLYRHGYHFLLVAFHSSIVDGFLRFLAVKNKVKAPPIDIHKLVLDFVAQPRLYSLKAVFADVQGFGNTVNSVSMFGFDIAEAGIFKQMLPNLVCNRVHLRDVRTGIEVLGIDAKGAVNFFFRRAKSLSDAEAALKFLSEQKYIIWSVENHQ